MKEDYIEGIEKCISFMEANLSLAITVNDIMDQTFYSYPHMYRVFTSFVGTSISTYLRNRRLTKAAEELITTNTPIIEIALKYQFASQQTFTRAFHELFLESPNKFREKGRLKNMYQRFNFDEEFMKNLKPVEISIENVKGFKVASCHKVCSNEKQLDQLISNTWNTLIQWQMKYEYHKMFGRDAKSSSKSMLGKFMIENKLHVTPNTAYYGFNNPFPPNDSEYGYEAWAMINDPNLANSDVNEITIKSFDGGLYATAYATYGDNSNLDDVWKYMHYWMSKQEDYTYGDHQWLEEHLTVPEEGGFHGFKLFMPLRLKI